ncbi:MAG: carboxypeptidase M32 [Candidatus Nitrohelix vancouverensis]|uniref:Metal-dependent carboxypeptidase n=1 Tax=Candidatus Nitrohelix vancouverensis TaxID=2705534 RepID=A0A7T0C3R8_9BACT|nr:MAG: carboxypeptidase M32 [Candidatus Nitrohelix vancouverensis]
MNETQQKKYEELVSQLTEVSRLGSVMGIMHWDQEVIMPSGAAESRAGQMAALAGVLHEKSSRKELGALAEDLFSAGPDNYSLFEWRNIAEAKREYDLSARIPKALVQELASLSSQGHHVWVKARQENSFSSFVPTLKRFVQLKKEWAGYAFPELSTYDATIDIYERGMSAERLTAIFDTIKTPLKNLIQGVAESSNAPDGTFLKGSFPVADQEALGKKISQAIGFSFDHGRMDVSVHPFCGGGDASDVRITTRYREDNFIESLYAVIHETGHGLYEQGRMREGRDLPASESLTMGIHESQSLFWERMIAQGRPFCGAFLQTFAEAFPENFKNVSAETLYRGINMVSPSFIRVEADEATYPLHVILRFEIEKGLFDDSLKVEDLPEIWNAKMQEYLGICPPNDASGVLQDVHWSGGAFGYFPSYTLGAMYACQFYQALREALPGVEDEISQGNLAPVKNWLNENIHQQGKLYTPDELVLRVTGKPLDPQLFINYLTEKYRSIYSLN